MRQYGARMVHLVHLREHQVYEELDLPQGIRPLSIRWVDEDDHHTAKSRLTARGHEQELTGQDNFYQCDTTAGHAACAAGLGSGSGTDRGIWRLRSSLSPSSSSREVWFMGHTTAGSRGPVHTQTRLSEHAVRRRLRMTTVFSSFTSSPRMALTFNWYDL